MLNWIRGFFSGDGATEPANQHNVHGVKQTSRRTTTQPEQKDLDDRRGQDRILIRPQGPYEQWRLPDSVSILSETKVTEPLNAYLRELEEMNSGRRLDATNSKIFHDVAAMVNQTFERLNWKCPVFRDAVVHTVGSVGEQTKIGIYDEFDFMVELPALEQRLVQEATPMMQEQDPASVLKIKNMDFMLDFMPQNQVTYVENGTPDLFATLKSLVSQELFSCLLPNWEPGPNFKVGSSEDKGKVRTIRLRYDGSPEISSSHMYVFCDFSFCVPFQWSGEKRCLYRRSGTRKDMLSDTQTYRLLVRNSEFWVSTTVLHERNKLCNSPASHNVRRVYKMAKLVLEKLLPPIYDFKLDNFEGIIPSYWIKQVILYLMEEFPHRESWHAKFLGHRLRQVIRNLHKCFEKNMLSNYFSPMLNHLMDNSKIDEKRMACKYVPLVDELLSRTATGGNSAVTSLRKLEILNAAFRNTVAAKAKLMRLFLLILRYKGLTWKDPYVIENTKFFSNVMEVDLLLGVIKDYIKFHFSGVVKLHGEGRNLRIVHKHESLSVDDFITKIRDDPHTFPDDWAKLYDRMLEERMPEELVKSLSHHTYQPIPLGDIIRGTFGEKRQPHSMKDQYLMTHEFLIF